MKKNSHRSDLLHLVRWSKKGGASGADETGSIPLHHPLVGGVGGGASQWGGGCSTLRYGVEQPQARNIPRYYLAARYYFWWSGMKLSAEPFCGAIFVQALWLAAWLAIGYAAVPDFPDGAFIHG